MIKTTEMMLEELKEYSNPTANSREVFAVLKQRENRWVK